MGFNSGFKGLSTGVTLLHHVFHRTELRVAMFTPANIASAYRVRATTIG